MHIVDPEFERKVESVLRRYTDAYEEVHKTKPVSINRGVDRTTIKDILRILGEERALEVVAHYVRMNDDWYVKKGHSLQVLKENLNVVNTSLSKKVLPFGSGQSPLLNSLTPCIKCDKYQYVLCKAEDIERINDTFICDSCLL